MGFAQVNQRPSQRKILNARPRRMTLVIHTEPSCRWSLWMLVPIFITLCSIVAWLATCEVK